MDNYFLYIDPGTGSMLFSVIIGLVASLYFLAKALWIKIKFFFTGRGGKSLNADRKKFVIYSEGPQYSNVFSPILEEFERRKIDVDYLTSSESDPAFARGYSNVHPQYIGDGNKAYARLNFLEADVCLMTTPGLDVYQLKRSKAVKHYAHVLHSVDDATSYRLFGLDYFDSVLLSGEYQRSAIRQLEALRGLKEKELPVVGCPYLDVLSARKDRIAVEDKRPLTVLVSPSWGPSAILSRYGEKLLDPLLDSGLRVIVRPHPQSLRSEKSMVDALKARYEGRANIEWDFSAENLTSLSRSDVMISDFSGIVFDYAFLFGRPIIFANADYDDQIYDSSDLGEVPWKFRTLREIGTELSPENIPGIVDVVTAAAGNDALRAAAAKARDEAWQFRGEAGAKVVDYLIKTQGSLSC